METDDAGLGLVDYIRNELKNETVRIILRTGQPGQAPERRVIVDYDINDYKAKTELTADKLFTALTAALRSYQQLQRMVETRRGLEMIIEGASTPVRLQVDATARARACSPRSHRCSTSNAAASWSCAREVRRRRSSPYSPAPAATATTPERAGTASLDDVLARSRAGRVRAPAATTSIPSSRCSTSAPRAGARWWWQWRRHERSPPPTVRWSRCSAAAFPSPSTTSSSTSSCMRRMLRLEERVRERTRALTSANERLTSQWARIRRANEYKNEVLGTVAHDLRNPLSVILGRAEMMNELAAMNPVPLDKVKDQLGHIRSSASQLTGMVNDLISDAMMNALDIAIKREPADLAALLGEIVASNRALAEKKDQTIHLVSPPHQLWSCDPDRLREAIDNLVSNAIKYSPIGGIIELSMAVDDDGAVIRVKDDGAGLSPDDVVRLFGRFQRLSAKPTGGENSTGLGLSIVKRIVELHGGRVDRRESGSGPRRHLHHPAAARGSAQMNKTQHIIVVDDEAPAREMVGDYLKLHGFEVTLCDGGSSLRQCITKQVPDLIVLDLNMPEEDGLSIVRAVKQSTRCADHHAHRDRECYRSCGRARARR